MTTSISTHHRTQTPGLDRCKTQKNNAIIKSKANTATSIFILGTNYM